MRAGNPEVAAQKPTARSSVSNGRDILPDAWDRTSVHPSRTPDTGNRRDSPQTSSVVHGDDDFGLHRADLADAPLGGRPAMEYEINPRGLK